MMCGIIVTIRICNRINQKSVVSKDREQYHIDVNLEGQPKCICSCTIMVYMYSFPGERSFVGGS